MKDLTAAIDEALQSAGVAKHELTELILDGKCRVTELTPLRGMDALTRLSLCNVGLQSLDGFPVLENLANLNLADNKIKNGLGRLDEAQLVSLRVLSLAHNRIEEMVELEDLRPLGLTHLDLCDCPLSQREEHYRERVFEVLPTLQVLDNLDRDGIDLLNYSDDSSEEEEEEDEESEGEASGDMPELLNLITDSDDDQSEMEESDSEAEEIHVSVLAQGPPIADDQSADDQDYIMPEDESDSDEDSYESDEHISVSHHFAAGSSSGGGPSAGGSSDAAPGEKRKRSSHGTEDLTRDVPRDEDYTDI